jgi:hypothetical protein
VVLNESNAQHATSIQQHQEEMEEQNEVIAKLENNLSNAFSLIIKNIGYFPRD